MLDEGDKPIRWGLHTLDNLHVRKIDPAEVLRTVEAPDAVVPGRTADRSVSRRRHHDPRKGKTMLLLAVVEDAPDARVIVTVYHTSRPQRYLRGTS
jgi:hypothetical protein